MAAVGVPVSFPDAPVRGVGGGVGGGRHHRGPNVKSADGSVIEMNYERGGGNGGFRAGGGSGNNNNNPRESESLDFLVRELKSKVKVSRSIWAHLPQTVCNEESMSEAAGGDGGAGGSASCWNGKERGRYSAPVVTENGLKAKLKNPEFPTPASSSDAAFNEAALKPHGVIQEQLVALKSMTGRLKAAYNGMDVTWPEVEPSLGGGGRGAAAADDELSFEGSGLYSGSGGGEGDDPEDDEPEEGSGPIFSGESPIPDPNPVGETPKPPSNPSFTPNKPPRKPAEKEPKPTKCRGKMIGKYCVVDVASTEGGAGRQSAPSFVSAAAASVLCFLLARLLAQPI